MENEIEIIVANKKDQKIKNAVFDQTVDLRTDGTGNGKKHMHQIAKNHISEKNQKGNGFFRKENSIVFSE